MLIHACTTPKEKPLSSLEDIRHDDNIDKKDFALCDEDYVYQYFFLGDIDLYKGGKPEIVRAFNEKYDDKIVKPESGLIRVRFVVNCEGQTDRFRMIQSDLNYQEKSFDKSITDQIMAISKSLDKWENKYKENGDGVDHYHFFVFKIIDGKINKILP